MRILNKKAGFNYLILERLETGIALSGAETKAVLGGRADLTNAYAKIINGEVYLVNAKINTTEINTDPARSRKLLLHRSEITSIESKMKQKKLTLIPTKLYTKGHLVKAEIALAKGKVEFEKRQSIKEKDIERDIEQELRQKD